MIQPIVEGWGEVSAFPVLLRRLLVEAGIFGVQVGKPIRRKRSELVQEAPLRHAIQLAKLRPGCSSILILFDSDDECPKELAPVVEQWATDEAGDVPCAVVMAHREYEAWFLASIESLRGHRGIRDDAEPHPRPETPRGAKQRLEERMRPGLSYSETADQAALTTQMDPASAFAGCRSFRRLVTAFGRLLVSSGIGVEEWPPVSWINEP